MKNIIKRSLTALFAVAIATLALSSAADAATKYSKASGRWDAAATWTPSSVPSSTDDVIVMPGHTVTLGNTSANTTYNIRSLEVRANGLLQSLALSWRTQVVTSTNGPSGYAVLNLGQIHGQINRTSVIVCNGNLKTDGSGMTNRNTKPMGGYSWGWNNVGHSGNAWAHGHTGNNGDSTAGICLILTGGTSGSPNTAEQAQAININSAPFTPTQDALPRTFIKGTYELKGDLEINAFESRVELGGELDLNGYRMQVQGPLHTGDPGFNTVSYQLNTSAQGTFTPLGTGATAAIQGPGKTYSTAPVKATLPSDWVNNQTAGTGTFNFYGANTRDVWISVNGWLGFRSSYASSFPYNAIPNINYANGIAMPGGYYSGCPTTAEYVKYQVLGTSPNREFVVEWRCRYFSNTTGTQFRTQCRLQEGSNQLVFKYGSGGLTGTTNWNTSNMYMQTGIEDLSGSNGMAFPSTTTFPTYRLEPNNTLTWVPQYLTNPTATLRVGDGTGSTNQGTYPQFRITAGASNVWGSGSVITIPNGENGSMFVGAAVQMLGSARLDILGEPTVPTNLQNGGAPTCWILGYFALGGTAQVNCTVPTNPANPTNSMLQVGQALDFLDNQTTPPTASTGVINLTGNHGATGFPVLLVQGGSGGGLNFITNSLWSGQPGGVTPGADTAGINLNNSVFVHQGGLSTNDSFKVTATGGNPGSLWGPHSMVVGLDQYNWQSSTVTIANGTNIAIGGQGSDWDLDGVGIQVKGNRLSVNGGGGNVFISNGAKFASYGLAPNMPANGSVGMVDIGGNLQVTSAAEWHFGADLTGAQNQAGHESTMRILGQGTIPPALGVGPQSLQRRAPLGNLSIDDGGYMSSAHTDNVLVFIGEKWHSASTTVKVHPWKVENLISYPTGGGPNGNGTSTIPLVPSGGTGPWTFSITGTPGGSLSGGTGGSGNNIITSTTSPASAVIYACPAGSASVGVSGTDIIRCTDSQGESFDAVVSYRPKSLGALMLSPGWITPQQIGWCYYFRSNVANFKPTLTLRAYGGTSTTYNWSLSSTNGTLSSTTGPVVTFTAGTTTTANTVTLTNGPDTRQSRLYHTTSTFYGDRYPSPYYMVHLRINETQQFRLRPAVIHATATPPAWSFTSNASGARFTGTGAATNGLTASGATATVNTGTTGGITTYTNYTRGQVTWTNTTNTLLTGWFYMYVTALPSDLTLGPTEVAGWLPGQSFTFTGTGGATTPSYTYSLSTNGGGTPSPSVTSAGTAPNRYGNYTSGGSSLGEDAVTLGDGTGNTVTAAVKKGLATPAFGNSFIAVPGAKTIFTNSTVNSVDQIIFSDTNDQFGRFQVLKTLSTGNKVLPSSIEISPILLTLIANTSQTFTVAGGTGPYAYSISSNNSGGSINATTGAYTSGTTINVTDTVVVTDANGKIARATVNVVSQGGASPLEIRPRYIYYIHSGQQLQFRTVGGKGGIAWTITQNNSGGGITSQGLYTAGTPGNNWAWDDIQVSDATGDVDKARVGVYNWTSTSFYMFPMWCYWDYNTGSGKSRNGFIPGQTLNITTRNGPNLSWIYSSNQSGGSLSTNGSAAVWTAGNTSNVTDNVQASSTSGLRTGLYKVQPPPMAVTPSQASAFGGTVINFQAQGGTGNYTYAVFKNNSGTTTVSGSGASFSYTAGASPGIDVIRVADGVSFADVAVSVLGASNPTVINANMLEVYHGELDLNGRIINVTDSGASNPTGRGDVWFTNGGFTGATNPKLSMTATPTAQDPATLNVGRTFIWNPNSDENVTAGTIQVDGSMNVTDALTGPVFDLNLPGSSTSKVILTGDNPDYPVSTPSRVEVWRATTTGGAPTMAGLSFDQLQVGPGATGSQLVRFGTVCYTSFATQGPNIPTMQTLTGGSIPTAPANNCNPPGSTVPPGFQQWTALTTNGNNPATLPNNTATIPSGVWLTMTSGSCWVINAGQTVTVQGGLVIEDGCVDIRGTLIVQGDVFIGVGTLTQDRANAPTLIFSGTSTPTLDVQESSPGTGGTFASNIGGVVTFPGSVAGAGVIRVENSLKALADVTNSLTFTPTFMEFQMAGAGQEAASSTSPQSSRLWLADDNYAAMGLTMRNLVVNKTNASDLLDINSPVTVTNTFDVQSGDVYGTLGNGSVILTGATWTNGTNANYDIVGGTIGSNNWGPFNVYLDGTGGTVQSVSATGTPTLPDVRIRHTGTGVGAGHVRLTSNVTANNWFILDGAFDPNGNTLTTLVDVTVGGNVPADATNAPQLFMNGGTDQVVAGQHFLFFPGAVETVTAGLIEAGGDFAITDTVARPFNLAGSTSMVRMSGPDVSTGPTTTRPAQIFSQDATNQPQTLQLNDFDINLNPGTSTVDLMSNVQVNGNFTLQNGNVQGTNGTLLLAGNWTSTGGAYGTFFNGAIQITSTTAVQQFSSTIPVPPVTINKTAGRIDLVGSFQTQGDLRLQDGILSINGAVLTVNGNLWVGVGIVATDRAAAPELRANSAGQSTIRVLSTNTVNGNFNFFGGCIETITNCILEVQRNVALEEDTNAADPNVSAPTRPVDFFNPITGAGNELRLTGANNGVVFLTDGPLQQNPITLEVDDLTIAKATVNDTIAFTSGIRVNGTYLHTEGRVTSGVIFVDGAIFTVQGGAYNAGVSIIVASPATQTFVSTVTLPQLFINKPGTNPLLVGNGATLQTGNFTIQDGTVDLNGGTLVVSGNFSVGDGSANDPINVPNFIMSTVAGSANGGTLDIQHTNTTNGNFQFFNGCTATIDTSTVFANGNVYVNDATFAFTGTNTVEMRNSRGATASLWSDRPVINPVITMVNLTLNKTPGGSGSQVDIGSDVIISGVLDVRGNTIVNGILGTNGPIQLTGTGTVLTTNGTSGSFTSGTAIEVIGTGAQTLTSGFPLGVVIVRKTSGTMTVGAGGLQTGVFQIQDGTVDLAGQTLRVNGWIEVGNGTPPGGVTPNLLCDGAGDLIEVIAPSSSIADGSFFWFADATGTLTNGQFDLEGNLDVRGTQQGAAVTWAPSGSHKVRMFQNRGSAVTASSTQIPNDPSGSLYQNATGTPLATLVLQDFEIAKSGTTGLGTQVNLNLTDVAVRGLFTLTSGTVNTATTGGAFVLKFEGNSTGTGGAFTPTSWVSYEGLSAQAMGGTGGALPNVQVVKTSGAPGNVLTVNATQQLGSLTVLDGTFDLQGTGNVTVIGGVTVGIGGNGTNLTANRLAAPEFRMSTSGTLSIGGAFAFWGGSVETINGGTINLTGNLALEEDSQVTGPKFDLSTSTALFNFTGGTAAQIFLQDDAGAAQTLELWDVTISKNTGITATFTGPVEVYGAFTMQSGTMATTAFGVVSLRGNWNHTGGIYATGTRMQLTGSAPQTLQAAGGILPSITVDKTGGIAQVNNGSTVQMGSPTGGELFWVKRGTFDLNGGTLQVNGIAFVGDNSGAAVTPVPTLVSATAGSVLDVNATTQPPTGFFVDGDFVLQHNGPNPTSVLTLTTGTLQVEHRLAIDHSGYTSTINTVPAVPVLTSGTPINGANFNVMLDGNADASSKNQGAGEIFNLQGILAIDNLEIAKTTGGNGNLARLLSGLDIQGNMTVTSGNFDMGNQSRIDLAGNWTVLAAGGVTPTITQLWLGTTATNTITVNSGLASFFDVVVNKPAAANQVTFTSTSVPVQPVTVERQLLIYTGAVTVNNNKQLVVGANSWLGNLLVGVNGITANPLDATLDIQPAASVGIGTGGTFAVDANGLFEQVGTNAGSRARLISSNPGVGSYAASISGVWRAQWYEVSSTNAQGMQLGGTATTPAPGGGQALADGLWDYPANGGVFLDLSNGPSMPTAVYRNNFNNTGSVNANGNIQASGSTATVLYLNAAGVLAGEAFDVEPAGPAPIFWNIATVDVTPATGTPATSNVLAGTTQHPIASFTLSETSATEGANITAITVTSSQALTNLSNFTLYDDADNSGTVNAGDTSLGAPTSTGGSTMTWSGAPFLALASGTQQNLLVVADVAGAATGSYTFRVNVAGDVTGSGASFGVAIQVTGSFSVLGNPQTVATAGLLTTSLGGSSPAAGNIVPNSQVVMGQWQIAAGPLENHTVTGFTFNEGLSANISATYISAAFVAVDNNNNGLYEAGIDAILASATGPVYTGSNVTLSGFNRVINAGSTLDIIFVQTFTNSVSAGPPADAYRTSLTGITSTGVTSTNSSILAGLSSQSTTQTVATAGSLDVAVGANNPTATAVVRTATNAVMGQFRIQVSQAEGLNVSNVTVTNSGTGATTNVTAVRLVLDINNNGVVDGTDTTMGSGTLSGATATINVNRSLAASTIEHWIVAYDLSAPVGELGNTHNVTLGNGSITGTGQSSTNALVLTGTPASGGAKTLTDGAPILTVSAGSNDPGARSISAGTTGVTLLQANLAATGENQTVSSIQVALSGSANDSLAIGGLYLIDDANNNGIADPAELSAPIAGPTTVPADNATITFGGLTYQVTSGNSRDLLVVADTSASGVQNGDTITATLTTVTSTGDTSSVASSTPGAPLSGGAQTLAVPGTLTVAAGSFMPGNQNLPSGTVAAPVWQGRVTANNTEDLLLTTFQVTQNSGMVGVFGSMRLYWDSNGNGQLDAADVALTPAGSLTGSVLPLQLGTAWTLNFRVSAGTSQNLMLVSDIAGSLGQTGVLSVETGDVSVQGISSGLDETNGIGISGLPVAGGTVTVGANGSVVVYTGANTSPSRTEPASTPNVPIGQFTLRASPAEAATLNTVTITGFPAGANDGDESTDLGNITLVEDVDGDGRASASELASNQLGTIQTYAINNGTVTFGSVATPLGVTIPAGGDLHIVLLYDISSAPTGGEQFLAGITTGANVTVTGQTTSTALPVTSASARTNFLTVGAGAAFTVSAGNPWPSSRYIAPSNLAAAGDILLSVLRLEASNGATGVTLGGDPASPIANAALTVWPTGTGNDATVTVKVWDDSTGTNPGVLDGADTLLGQSNGYPGDNQPWTMALTPGVAITAGSTTQWLVTYGLSGANYGDTFELRVTPAADLIAYDTTAGAGNGVTATGSVIQSATLTAASPPSFGGPVAVASGSSGGGCFIATAAAGYDSSLVAGLVHGRDTFLPGAIVTGYYRSSPPVAAAVAAHPGAAAGVRGGLAPFAGWAASGSLAGLLGLMVLAGLALVVTRRRTPAVVKA